MTSTEKNINKTGTKIIDAFIKEGVLFVHIKNNVDIELNHVEEAYPVIEKICDGKRYPLLLHTGLGNKVSSSARQYVAKEFKRFRIAEAIICESFYHKLMAQLYITINKPGNPVKVFTKLSDGENWLRHHFT